MPIVERTGRAKLDLAEIWSYIARDNEAAASRFIERVEERFRLLAQYPDLGKPQDRLARGLRSFPVDRYVIFYRSIEAGVRILRVLSGYRDFADLF